MKSDIAYCYEDGIDRLKNINPKFEIKNWCFDDSVYTSDYPNYKFWDIKPTKYYKRVKIPIQKVIGTNHINYSHRNWIKVLGGLKRFSPERSTYAYRDFFKSGNYGSLHYLKFNEDYFIGADGNHRTTIAKFLEIDYLIGDVTEYFFDQEFFDVYNKVKDLNLQPELERYDRNSIWTIKLNDIRVFIKNYNDLKRFVMYYDNLEINFKILLEQKMKYYLNKKSKANYLYFSNEQDISHIKNAIILHKLKKANISLEYL